MNIVERLAAKHWTLWLVCMSLNQSQSSSAVLGQDAGMVPLQNKIQGKKG